MREFKTIILVIFFFPIFLEAQVTYSEHVAPILYENCTKCHRPGEIAPFSLTNYSEASTWATMIKFVTQSKYMPPWSPDENYSHFVGEQTLTDAEIQTIADWVDGGAPQGNPSLEPPLPVFSTGSQIGTPDLVLQMAQPHNITGNFQDDYRVFVIPSGFTSNKEIASLEFRPDNTSAVHHVLFAYDLTGTAAAMDAATAEYGYVSFGDFGFNDAVFLPWVYTPGNEPLVLPEGIGEIIPANADLLVQVHYAPVGINQTDQSSVNVFYKDVADPIVREIQTSITSPADIVGGGFGSFFIPPNQQKTFVAEGTSNLIGTSQIPNNQDISLIGINPHMHLLGKSYEVFAVTPTNDTINLISIPDWDFNWQGAYTFEKMIKIPAYSQWFTRAVYDNTSSNPSNPNFPPQTVGWGDNTGDEMLIVFFYYVPYQNGDENISLGGCATLDLDIRFDGFPNQTSWDIQDTNGTVVASSNSYSSTMSNTLTTENTCLPDGCYTLNFYDALGNGMCPFQSTAGSSGTFVTPGTLITSGAAVATLGSVAAPGLCGNYSLRDANGALLVSGGGGFGASQTNNFCLSGGIASRIPIGGGLQQVTENAQISIIPNTVTHQTTLYYSLETTDDIQIQITDVSGKTIQKYTRKFDDFNEIQLNTSHLQKGFYYVQLVSGKIMLTEKFVKL